MSKLNIQDIRKDFLILNRELRPGVKLVYLDSAATSQKPLVVIKSLENYYKYTNANIHRGVHQLAEESTAAYEAVRQKIADFIKAPQMRQVIFVRNTTEAINLVAYTWGRKNIDRGDTILLTEMEHHSNLVPWQMLAEEKQANLEFVPVTDEGLLDMDAFYRLLEKKPKLVSFMHISNVLGTINPVKEMIAAAHHIGAVTLVDGAQSVPHFPVDVNALDADFYAFSGHKMCGPTGIGALYGRRELLESMPPFLGGGDMIKSVQLHSFTPNTLPHKFEAGTPAIAETIGFGAAIDYLSSLGMDNIQEYEQEITNYALDRLSEFPGIRILGPSAEKKGAVVSFSFKCVHPHDVAQILDQEGVAVRAGHHCAMPLHQRYNLSATTRASFYVYNTTEEVDILARSLEKVVKIFC